MNLKVKVYWNWTKKIWSIQHMGKVIAHEYMLKLHNCKFHVQPKGRERVRAQKRKNVHAFAVGDWIPYELKSIDLDGEEVTYNPYTHESFMKGNDPIHEAVEVHFSVRRKDDKKHPLVMIPGARNERTGIAPGCETVSK